MTLLKKHQDKWIETPGPLETPCYIWIAGKSGKTRNRPILSVRRKSKIAYRVIKAERDGPCPPGAGFSHLCHSSLCVNPDHGVWESNLKNRRREGTKGYQYRPRENRKNPWKVMVKLSGKMSYFGMHNTEKEARWMANAILSYTSIQEAM